MGSSLAEAGRGEPGRSKPLSLGPRGEGSAVLISRVGWHESHAAQLFGKHFPVRRGTGPEGATVRDAPGRFLLPESGLARGITWQSRDEELPERGAGYRSAFTASWIWRRVTSRATGGR